MGKWCTGALIIYFISYTSLANEVFVDTLFKNYKKNTGPGVAAMLIQNDVVIHSQGYGLADLKNKNPITPNTNFFLASLSKQFTGQAIALLIEQGKLSEDDSVFKYIPELPLYASAVKIDQLIHHTSGLRDYVNGSPDMCGKLSTNADVIKYLYSRPALDFPAGSHYSYSNTGYALLAMVIERITGETFHRFVDENIFNPLGMRGSQIHDKDHQVIGNSAKGYQGQWPQYSELLIEHCGDIYGDRGIYSSLEDFRMWIWGLQHVNLFSQVLTGIFAPQPFSDGAFVDYGFGWRMGSFNKHALIWHAGGWNGARNIIFYAPEMNLWITLLSNDSNFAVNWESDSSTYAFQILKKYLN